MYSILAKIIEPGEVFWRDIQKADTGVLLHLFIAALDRIGQTLSSISKWLRIVQAGIIGSLTDSEQDANASSMIVLDRTPEHITVKIAPATGWIAQTHPANTR